MRLVPLFAASALALAGCGPDPDPAPCSAAGGPPLSGECVPGGLCPEVAVAGDAPATTVGDFKGYADPALQADPLVPGRIWLAYSWPYVAQSPAPNMAAVESHLARSDDGGATFSFVRPLYAAPEVLDPEGSGQTGIASSETVSLAVMASGPLTTWYGAHLRYFLEPAGGYTPRYGTSWTVRVGAAASPEALGDPTALAKEVVIGVSTTAAVYGASVLVDQMAGVPIQRCAMLNNPTLFVRGGTLYLVVECLAFVGTELDLPNATMQLLATTPRGDPRTWAWRHVGVLADHGLAQELGSDTIRQPEVTEAADGTLLLVVTPARADPLAPTGTTGEGCVAVELDSIDPPALRRDCAGDAIVRVRMTGDDMGSCAHDPASATGLVPHSHQPWALFASGLRP